MKHSAVKKFIFNTMILLITSCGSDGKQSTAISQIAIGDSLEGGIVACLEGEPNENLIAAEVDADVGPGGLINWGNLGEATGATSQLDGATNSAIIQVSGFTVAPEVTCRNYSIDSDGNIPCISGTCYNDWFLPARNQLICLAANKDAIGGFQTPQGYWSSTEGSSNEASVVVFRPDTPLVGFALKDASYKVRCVRAFSP